MTTNAKTHMYGYKKKHFFNEGYAAIADSCDPESVFNHTMTLSAALIELESEGCAEIPTRILADIYLWLQNELNARGFDPKAFMIEA